MDQSNPETRFFDHMNPMDINSPPKHGEISLRCPIWSHVRKVNPRQEDILDGGNKREHYPQKLIFRRGYPYIESGSNGRVHSGLLFICFQKNIDDFEDIKKNLLNNKNFPVPSPRTTFSNHELAERHSRGRFTSKELNSLTPSQRKLLGLEDEHLFKEAKESAQNSNTQNTGREGLSGPSELGTIPSGQFLATVPLGGGYYLYPRSQRKVLQRLETSSSHRGNLSI